jgi:hypothetical protein
MTTKMKKHKRPSKPFAHNSEYFHTIRIEEALPENFKTALAGTQKMRECRNKVPVTEIEDSGRYYLLIPRQRLHCVATRFCNSLPTIEDFLLHYSGYRGSNRKRYGYR